MNLLNENGDDVKHLSPTKYRRLKKIVQNQLQIKDVSKIVVHLYCFLWNKAEKYFHADIYKDENNSVNYQETIHYPYGGI